MAHSRCPVCDGTGHDPAGWPDTVPLPDDPDECPAMCWCCRGAGELPEGARWRPGEGKNNRVRRVLAGISLRAQAAAMGITAAQLSDQERGLWRMSDETD